VNGATAAGFEKVGALRKGWRADIIGLDTDLTRAVPLHDVFSHLVYSAHGDDVRFTMVDGNVLQQEGEVRIVDADRIRRRGAEIASGMDLDAEREAAASRKP
jgi:cytosine/adenosine deaminase-related metal-dependent hydrolase